MSSVIIAGDTSGTVTLQAPAVAGSTVITLPTTSGTMLLTNGDGSALTNLPTPTALSTASGSAPSYSARAWVNFNGTGTVAIRTSGNVSSITDNGVGTYTLNFATALPDANYIFTTGNTIAGANVNGAYYTPGQTKTTTQFRIITYSYVATAADNSDVYITIYR